MWCVILMAILPVVWGSCPDGWVSHQQACYLFTHDREQWSDAYTLCPLFGGQLVEIDDPVKNAYLGSQARLYGRNFFIALTDMVEEGTWVWMNSKRRVEPAAYTNWNATQPNDMDDENCVVVLPGGQWADVGCDTHVSYICELKQAGLEIVG